MSEQAAPRDQFSGKRILVAEDEPFIGFDIVDAIEGASASALGPAGTVKAALDMLRTNEVDAAILDVNLLDGDVGPVIAVLTERKVPFIIHTGAGLTDALRTKYPDLAVFYKPTPPEALVDEIRRRLALSPS